MVQQNKYKFVYCWWWADGRDDGLIVQNRQCSRDSSSCNHFVTSIFFMFICTQYVWDKQQKHILSTHILKREKSRLLTDFSYKWKKSTWTGCAALRIKIILSFHQLNAIGIFLFWIIIFLFWFYCSSNNSSCHFCCRWWYNAAAAAVSMSYNSRDGPAIHQPNGILPFCRVARNWNTDISEVHECEWCVCVKVYCVFWSQTIRYFVDTFRFNFCYTMMYLTKWQAHEQILLFYPPRDDARACCFFTESRKCTIEFSLVNSYRLCEQESVRKGEKDLLGLI